MTTRYVTYDIKEGNSYDSLYRFFEDESATKLTESTYLTKTEYTKEQFIQKLKNVTSEGDSVFYICITTENHIIHRKVR